MTPFAHLRQKGIYCYGEDRLLLRASLNIVPIWKEMKKSIIFICNVN